MDRHLTTMYGLDAYHHTRASKVIAEERVSSPLLPGFAITATDVRVQLDFGLLAP